MDEVCEKLAQWASFSHTSSIISSSTLYQGAVGNTQGASSTRTRSEA